MCIGHHQQNKVTTHAILRLLLGCPCGVSLWRLCCGLHRLLRLCCCRRRRRRPAARCVFSSADGVHLGAVALAVSLRLSAALCASLAVLALGGFAGCLGRGRAVARIAALLSLVHPGSRSSSLPLCLSLAWLSARLRLVPSAMASLAFRLRWGVFRRRGEEKLLVVLVVAALPHGGCGRPWLSSRSAGKQVRHCDPARLRSCCHPPQRCSRVLQLPLRSLLHTRSRSVHAFSINMQQQCRQGRMSEGASQTDTTDEHSRQTQQTDTTTYTTTYTTDRHNRQLDGQPDGQTSRQTAHSCACF